ncbi:hypothetical protein [Yersinia proxima]|uniref:hypothetical protein n=1 Tax=Yersinia proxima TaxID=2890316 RepID=UPI001D10F528|nr:hypothetical protein [Yersinia proxima]
MDKHIIAHLKTVMDADQLIDFLADKLEAEERELRKPLPIGELIQRLENQTFSKWFGESDVKDLRDRAEKAEAELSAANEKLKGVPWRSFVTNDDVSSLNRFAECCDDPESGGHDLDKEQVERLVSIGALRKTKRNYHETTDFGDFVISAGFTVEGDPAPVKYIVILQRAWCNDSGSGINYHSDLIEFDNRDKAIKHGFKLQDSDDFNIGVLTNGALSSFDWMAKPLAETKDSLARIASGIGIEGNTDDE